MDRNFSTSFWMICMYVCKISAPFCLRPDREDHGGTVQHNTPPIVVAAHGETRINKNRCWQLADRTPLSLFDNYTTQHAKNCLPTTKMRLPFQPLTLPQEQNRRTVVVPLSLHHHHHSGRGTNINNNNVTNESSGGGWTKVTHGDPLLRKNERMAPSRTHQEATPNTTIPPKPSSSADAASTAQEWDKAYVMLQQNPKLLTRKIFCAALRRQAPVRLIAYMLHLDPALAAAVPRNNNNKAVEEGEEAGPTPLQIALQSFCSMDVITELLQAYPLALVVKSPGSQMYPLSYAKIIRSDEPDLIELLSRPVKFWQQQQQQNPYDEYGDPTDDDDDDSVIVADTSEVTIATTNVPPATAATNFHKKAVIAAVRTIRAGTEHHTPLPQINKVPRQEPTAVWTGRRVVSPEDASQVSEPASFLSSYSGGRDTTIPSVTVAPQMMHPVRINTTDPNEIKNVMSICMSVLKGHKRLARDMTEVQRNYDELVATESKTSLPSIALMIKSHGNSILQQVRATQKTFARSQLLAQQQNEQTMKGYVDRTEHRLIRSMSQRQQETHGTMEMHMDAVVQALQVRLSQFSDRIAFLEQAVYFTANKAKRTSGASSSRRRAATATERPPPVITLTIPDVSIIEDTDPTRRHTNVYHDKTSDESSEVDTVSPFTVTDEKRALLTEAAIMHPSDGTTSNSYCSILVKKRWFHKLRKKSFWA
jgi:hypothetical protein